MREDERERRRDVSGEEGSRPSAGRLPGWPRARRYGASQGARRPRWLIHATVPCVVRGGSSEGRGQIARGGAGRVGATRTARPVREVERRDETISNGLDATRGCGPGEPRRRIPPRRARERRAPPTPRASRGSLALLACRWTALGECGSPEKLRTFLLRRPKRKTADDGARRAWRNKFLARRDPRIDGSAVSTRPGSAPRDRPTSAVDLAYDHPRDDGKTSTVGSGCWSRAPPTDRHTFSAPTRPHVVAPRLDGPRARHPERAPPRASSRTPQRTRTPLPPGLPPAPSRPWRHLRPRPVAAAAGRGEPDSAAPHGVPPARREPTAGARASRRTLLDRAPPRSPRLPALDSSPSNPTLERCPAPARDRSFVCAPRSRGSPPPSSAPAIAPDVPTPAAVRADPRLQQLPRLHPHPGRGHQDEIRQTAGLLLKNNLKTGWLTAATEHRAYIQHSLLPGLGHPNRFLRHTVGTCISMIARAAGPAGGPTSTRRRSMRRIRRRGARRRRARRGVQDCEELNGRLDVPVPGSRRVPPRGCSFLVC